ncbi:MAG: aromatic ring-hydroxylating dioxygenase subunit alpha [Gammaproteobacteria bacterium]|nr:aromatic ring-hydroxylating dioxygenase subunit alpha [Gammaproteobacteria bacterium]MDH4313705.1 aromatic ring-hydroxylating dioxygenase subunit alpha [Gammaproteobacteria bacterium]MDH5212949.1 aromatic ring-hydroxylating dioxygenase subunit alpha [Gammaproteobacteria bacterium]MDH5501200.1 aromatic ring-hydroxylating dioxygenase subunit alpha [Gammaproteobacteria bacterium]
MLTDYWYIACPTGRLRGKPIVVNLLSRNIVLFRDADGLPVALENRCAHRGMPLADGKVVGGRLQCSYHGWCYDRTGCVVHVPSQSFSDGCRNESAIRRYRCCEQDGYIWVCPGVEPRQETPQKFPFLGEHGWTSFRLYNRFEAPVESCLENFLDCPHATFVHRSWFRSPTDREVRCRVSALEDGAVAEYFDEPRERSLVWSLLSPQQGGMQHSDRFIAPAMSRVDYVFSEDRHYTITSSCTPVNDVLTDVYTVVTFRYRKIGALLRLVFEPLSRKIIAQDVRTLRKQQRNLAKYERSEFRIIEQDVLLPHIRRWRNALSEGRVPAVRTEPYDVRIVI